jgi:hypothetical protein
MVSGCGFYPLEGKYNMPANEGVYNIYNKDGV